LGRLQIFPLPPDADDPVLLIQVLLVNGRKLPTPAFGFVSAGFVSAVRLRIRWQLQDRRMLANAQARQQNHLAIREFQGIVVFVRVLKIDLPKARDVRPQFPPLVQAKRVIAFNISVKTQLGSRTQAHRHVRLTNGRKAAGKRVAKLRGNELIADFRGTVRYVLEAVIAHMDAPLLAHE
jgi:hypothetical protein